MEELAEPKKLHKTPELAVPTQCSHCGSVLKYVPWNDETDVAVCENFHCPKYRSPIAIPRGTASGVPVLKKKRGKSNAITRGSKASRRSR